MFCTKCGTQSNSGQVFCSNCGERLSNSTPIVHSSRGGMGKGVLAIIAFVVVCILYNIFTGSGHQSKKTNVAPRTPSYNYNAVVPQMPDLDAGSYDTPIQTQRTPCISCHGSGSCPICHGTGQYSMYGNDYTTCTACGGKGVCSICDGTGYN